MGVGFVGVQLRSEEVGVAGGVVVDIIMVNLVMVMQVNNRDLPMFCQ